MSLREGDKPLVSERNDYEVISRREREGVISRREREISWLLSYEKISSAGPRKYLKYSFMK